MKKLLIVIIVISGLIFAYYKFWTSDSNERRLRNKITNCLESKLKTLESSAAYQTVFKEANMFYQAGKDTLRPFAEIKAPVDRVFDKYVFFYHDSTKCILMLQDVPIYELGMSACPCMSNALSSNYKPPVRLFDLRFF